MEELLKELTELRNFKKEAEDSCSCNAVIQNMNKELDLLRDNLTTDINKYKNMAMEYENHINHLYESVCYKIKSKIEENYENFGMSEFNIVDTICEYVDAYDVCELLKIKLKYLFIQHNSKINNYFYYYYLQNNPNEWIVMNDINNNNYINLVCPDNDIYYTECNCKLCKYFRGEDISEDDFDY